MNLQKAVEGRPGALLPGHARVNPRSPCHEIEEFR